MTFRKLLFWLHLVTGVAAGIVVLVMSVTGVLLTYEKQMIRWADPTFSVAPPPGAIRLPVEHLLAKFQESTGETPASVTVRPDADAPVEFVFGREGTTFIDPYTGAVLGEGSRSMRRFVTLTIDVHRWLALKDAGRATGRAITGAANLAFLFIVVSGIYLWWPKQWTLRHLRPSTWFQGGLGPKARDWNWHNAIGFWCALPLFLVVISASVISYPWATRLVYTLTGTDAPSGPGAPKAGGPAKKGGEAKKRGEAGPGATPAAPQLKGLGAAVDRLRAQSDWETITVRPPASGRGPANVSIERGGPGRPDLRTAYTFKSATGELALAENYSDFNAGRRVRTWLRWIHTGEAGGIPGQTLAGVASLGAVFLVYTGLALSLRRFAAWRRRRVQNDPAAVERNETVSV